MESIMSYVEKTIEVNAPLNKVYNQWTQFESFPEFMQGVVEVKQLDDKRLRWKAQIAGKQEEWTSEIYEQVPDQKIAWRSIEGAKNGGVVKFKALGADRTEITLRLEYEPEGIIEKAGDMLGVVTGRVEGDLQRFKQFIEQHRETGAWRGEIHH
jgi:uncharacterized membrane protein